MSPRVARWAAVMTVAMLLGSAGTVWARTLSGWNRPAPQAVLCDDYRSFAGAVLGHGALADAGLRMTAARLQHTATRYAAAQPADSGAARDAARALRLLLNAPYANRADLFIAARPVAVICGLDWRKGSDWEFAPGS